MPGKLNRYEMRPFMTMGPGVLQDRHISSFLGAQPVELNDVMTKLWASNNLPNFETFLQQFTKVREFEDDSEYTWKVIGTTARNIPLIEARNEFGIKVNPGDGNIGQGGTPFQLVFAEAWFADGEVIVGNLNEFYQCKIMGEPIMEGANAVYTVTLMHGADTGMPDERLKAGERFSVEFSPVESEMSRKAGGIRRAAPTSLRNEFTTIRKYHKVEGKIMNQRKFATRIPLIDYLPNGKTVQRDVATWISNEEWIFENEWRQEKNRALMYSRSNRNSNGEYFNHGKSGNVIKEGNGIMAQMELGNWEEYNTFSLRKLENNLMSLFEANNTSLKDRNVVIMTGNRGMMQASREIEANASKGWTRLNVQDSNFHTVKSVSSESHQNAYAYGFQFVQYMGPQGLVITFMYEPSYDNPERNKIPGFNGEGVLNSYRYDIFNLGSSDAPNMYLCKVKGNDDIRGYRSGFRNPFTGQTNINYMSYDEDSAEIHAYSQVGACIVDPTKVGSYVPAGLVG